MGRKIWLGATVDKRFTLDSLSQPGVCEMRYVSRRDHLIQNTDRSIIDSLFALPYWL